MAQDREVGGRRGTEGEEQETEEEEEVARGDLITCGGRRGNAPNDDNKEKDAEAETQTECSPRRNMHVVKVHKKRLMALILSPPGAQASPCPCACFVSPSSASSSFSFEWERAAA